MTNEHSDFIEALGGTGAVADRCDVQASVVSNWKRRGIAWRYRPALAQWARRKRVPLPHGFLTGE